MREKSAAKRRLPSFEALLREVSGVLDALSYVQRPTFVGPASVLEKRVPRP